MLTGASRDDLAKPDTTDPVERESTRVWGIAVKVAQTNVDPKLIEPAPFEKKEKEVI